MIDIIIPVYNANKTLAKTLNSILDQTMKDEINVIIVDDCSTEEYDDLIHFFSKYLRIKVLKLEKNSGPGVARQYGIDHSTGEYILFIDSDDIFVNHNSVQILKENMKDVNIAFSTITQVCNGNKTTWFHENCLHGKMYRRSFIKENNIRFTQYRIHEDNVFNQLCLALTEKVNYIEEPTYIYYETEKSIVHTIDHKKSLQLYIKSIDYLFTEIEKNKNKNIYYAGIAIFGAMLYLYFNYLLEIEKNVFIFEKASFLKKMYKKYKKNISKEDEIRIYKNFDYPIIPEISLNEFVRRIKD